MIPVSGRSPGGGHGNTLQYSCRKNPHGQRSLVGYSPWGHKPLDMTEVTKHMLTFKEAVRSFTVTSALGAMLSCNMRLIRYFYNWLNLFMVNQMVTPGSFENSQYIHTVILNISREPTGETCLRGLPWQCIRACSVTQLCQTVCDPMDCSP